MLYLVHMTVFEAMGKYWKRGLEHAMVGHEGFGYLVVYFGFWIVMLPIVLAVAGQVTRFVDEPSVQFAKWLEMKFIEDTEREEVIPL